VVDGQALSAPDRTCVVQLDVGGDVLSRQDGPAMVAPMFNGQGTVVMDGQHPPAVAVLHPVAAAVDRHPALVLAGRDPVANAGSRAVTQLDAVDLDLSGENQVGTSPGVELGNG